MATEGWRGNIDHSPREPNMRRPNLQRPMLQKSLSFTQTWIWRLGAIQNTCKTVRRRLHDLHEAIASSFEEVKAQCLPFPNKDVKIEEMIDWVVREVKVVSASGD
jgi:hypothetical protein